MLTDLNPLSPDPLFKLLSEYEHDANPDKLNLGIGVFVTQFGEPYVMPSIRQAMSGLPDTNNNYTPISGHAGFLQHAAQMVLGSELILDHSALQATCGGTHACSLSAALAKRAGYKHVMLPEPTWVNHKNIFTDFSQITFPHLNDSGQTDINAYRTHIEAVTEPTILLLHGGPTHNPTGLNLSLDQIGSLVELIKSKPILVFIDFAYLGLGDGIAQDAASTRLLFKELDEVAVGISFSKNATLYCHRTGLLMVKTKNKQIVESNLKQLMRSNISTAPAMGQLTLNSVFEKHYDAWLKDIDDMRQSVDYRRNTLIDRIPSLEYLKPTRGLFGMLKMSPDKINRLRQEFAIYIPDSGRINFAGIRMDKIAYLIDALKAI